MRQIHPTGFTKRLHVQEFGKLVIRFERNLNWTYPNFLASMWPRIFVARKLKYTIFRHKAT
jgi:hypothetical protein